jgi:ferric-dicitrate binding protein FerR (iron transport regulator)
VEATRDGRLTGNDLSNALRHRTQCLECSQAAEAFSELARQIKELPLPAPDLLSLRRTRQALLGAWNAQLLAEAEPQSRRPSAWIAAACAVAAVALVVGYPLARQSSRSSERSAPFFAVVAKPGTRWSAREMPNLTRVTLQDGVASFTVQRPPAQRLFVELPDGEIEDLGTIFQVEVHDQRTAQISVSQGRVLVRLQALPAFELKAGQSWQAAPDSPSAVPSAAPLAIEPARAKPSRIAPAAKGPVAQTAAKPAPLPPLSNTAEDEAYLQLIDLLRNGHQLEARAKASQYLKQFPNGFRRLEVAHIAQR